jgi:hypothetical protein
MPLPLPQLSVGKIRMQLRRCGFLTATRKSLCALEHAMARGDGMPRRGLSFLRSASAGGCDADEKIGSNGIGGAPANAAKVLEKNGIAETDAIDPSFSLWSGRASQ